MRCRHRERLTGARCTKPRGHLLGADRHHADDSDPGVLVTWVEASEEPRWCAWCGEARWDRACGVCGRSTVPAACPVAA